MDKVLVVGGSGFIGTHLVNRLSKSGADVSVMDIFYSPFLAQFHRADVVRFEDCLRVVGRVSPDYIFYLAAQSLVGTALNSPFDTLETNIRGAYNFLQAVRDTTNVKGIVWVSTDKVYGSHDKEVTELDELRGDDHPYNASKLCGDVIARMFAKCYGLPIVIVRSGNIYGPGDLHWNRIVPGTIRRALYNQNPMIRIDGIRDYIYVDDIVDGYLLSLMGLLDHKVKSGNSINFGAYFEYSAREIISAILHYMKKDNLMIDIKAKQEKEIQYQHLDWSISRNILGWTPKVGLQEGLKKSIAWYKENIR